MKGSMSAIGTKRTFLFALQMSAFGGKIFGATSLFLFVYGMFAVKNSITHLT